MKTCDHKAPLRNLDDEFAQCSMCHLLIRKRMMRRTDPYSAQELRRVRMITHSFVFTNPAQLWEIVGRLLATIDNHETVPGFIR